MGNMDMGNFEELMKQAQEMQEKMKQAQDAIANLKVVGEAGTEASGKVRLVMTGRHDALRITIDNQVLSDKQMLEELVVAAINDAVRKVEDESRTKMVDFAQSLNLPKDFKLPF